MSVLGSSVTKLMTGQPKKVIVYMRGELWEALKLD